MGAASEVASAPADGAGDRVDHPEEVPQLVTLVGLDREQDRVALDVEDDDSRRPVCLEAEGPAVRREQQDAARRRVGVRSTDSPRRPSIRTSAGRVDPTPSVATKAATMSFALARGSTVRPSGYASRMAPANVSPPSSRTR